MQKTHGVVHVCQEKDDQVSKTIKTPTFYMSLIVGKYLFHNCMIDSGVNTSIMPKRIIDILGLKYSPMSRVFLQLDGSIVSVQGEIKNHELTLHSYPNLTITYDILFIDIPPMFSICFSRDFTNKLGGYLSSD